MLLKKDANDFLIQGFAPDPSKAQRYTVGTSDPIDVSLWIALRWKTLDGSEVTRLFNGATYGWTDSQSFGVDILTSATTVAFTGAGGTVVEIEGM